jgi:hypothetical protein
MFGDITKKVIKCKLLDEVKALYMAHVTYEEGDDMVMIR